MSVQQIQLDRLSRKFANLVTKRSPEFDPGPSMAISNTRLYTEVVKQPARHQVWRSKATSYPVESKTRLVRRKLEELLAKSTSSNPMCLRCGSAGHRASDCRNAQLCFVCNKFGHKSIICRASTSIFPFTSNRCAEKKLPDLLGDSSPPTHTAISSPLSITKKADPPPTMAPPRRGGNQPLHRGPEVRRAPPVPPAPPAMPAPVPGPILPRPAALPQIRAPIQIFTPSAASEAQEREFNKSFILDDVAG